MPQKSEKFKSFHRKCEFLTASSTSNIMRAHKPFVNGDDRE